MQKRWIIGTPAPPETIDALAEAEINPVLAQILYKRGYQTAQEVIAFLKQYDLDDNPFRIMGMVEAVYRIRRAIRHREKIAVYGDFDCDGVTATVVLSQALARLGADVIPYIPDRIDEGYGLNTPALKALAEMGVTVVVTVDCGIRSVQEVADANQEGLDVIISDHHSIGPEIPPALAILNPKQVGCPYPEKMLAGVGLAYKIVQALYMEAQRRGYRGGEGWRPEQWLDLVAIGTVADIAPLCGENRVLVSEGLKRLNRPERPGVMSLLEAAHIKPGKVDTTGIGFMLGPRINAAGRLRNAMLAYHLLTASDLASARRTAQELNALNEERQGKTREMHAWAEEALAASPSDPPLIFAANPRFEQGIVGLVASRLTEQYYRPSVIVQTGEHESHGSCRSIPEFHITHALDECRDLLERYGGHGGAAGFTVQTRHVPQLRARLQEIALEWLAGHELVPTLQIDAELTLEQLTSGLARSLKVLEPTGECNPAPVFLTRGASIAQRVVMGSNQQHLKLYFASGSNLIEAVAFHQAAQAEVLPDVVDVAYRVEINQWNGTERVQMTVEDIRVPQNSLD